MSETTGQAEAPAMNATARWVGGGLLALALAIAPALIAWGVMSTRLEEARKDLSKVEVKVETMPALDARLTAAEGRIMSHDKTLDAMRADGADVARQVAETNGLIKAMFGKK